MKNKALLKPKKTTKQDEMAEIINELGRFVLSQEECIKKEECYKEKIL